MLEFSNNSILSNNSFINTLCEKKETFTYDYSISNDGTSVGKTNKELLKGKNNQKVLFLPIITPSIIKKHKEKSIFDSQLLLNLSKPTLFEETSQKIKTFEKDLRLINKDHYSLVQDIQKEFSESNNETIDFYRDYLYKFKGLLLNKVKTLHLALEEVSNERDEYKDCSDSLLLAIEEKENEFIFKQKEILDLHKEELEKKETILKEENEKVLLYKEENRIIKFEIEQLIFKLDKQNIEIKQKDSSIDELQNSLKKDTIHSCLDQILTETITQSLIKENKSLKFYNIAQKESFDIKKRQLEEKLAILVQKEQMKALVISSFNKKMSSVKQNPCETTGNTSFNEGFNSVGSSIVETNLSNSFNIQTTMRNLSLLKEEKLKIKLNIKEWTDSFENTHNRKPFPEEKREINGFYSLYNNYSQKIKFLEDKIEGIKGLKAQICNPEGSNKSKSVSPMKAHLNKLLQMKQNNIIGHNYDIINTSSNNITNITNNNDNNISINQIFEPLKPIINQSSFYCNNTCENTMITEENDENIKAKINFNENEHKYNRKLKEIEDSYKKKINEIIKTKDLSLKKLQGDLIKLKGEFEKNNRILVQANEKLLEEKRIWLASKGNLETQLKIEILQRKSLHNSLEDLKGKIRVYCRIRPLLPSEAEKGHKTLVHKKDDLTLVLETKQGVKSYNFDAIFDTKSSQEEIFEDSKKLIQSVIDGYNVCMFAYGQTGSGKTFTMQGTKENPGIMIRSINELFRLIEPLRQSSIITLQCYIVEVYMDTLIDVLAPKDIKPLHLDLKEDYKGMIIIHNITKKEIRDLEEFERLLKIGVGNRKTGKTDMNDESSRSHLIVTVMVEVENKEKNINTIGKLSLIDLAGSERVAKSNPSIKQLNESRGINKSLSALGNVISALSDQENTGKERFIPYRDNKLTLLMKDSLGGNSKTLMFLNLPPNDYNLDESLNSLYYATRVKNIINDPTKIIETKETIKMKEKFNRLYEENEALKLELKKQEISGKKPLKSLLNRTFNVDLTGNKSIEEFNSLI